MQKYCAHSLYLVWVDDGRCFILSFTVSSIPPAAEMSTVRTSTTENPAYHSFDKCGLSFSESFGVINSYSMYSTLQKSAVCTWLLRGQQVTFSITVQKFHMSPNSIFTISDGSDRFARILFGGHNVQDTASITFESSQSSVFIYYYNPQIYNHYRDTGDSFIIKYFKKGKYFCIGLLQF